MCRDSSCDLQRENQRATKVMAEMPNKHPTEFGRAMEAEPTLKWGAKMRSNMACRILSNLSDLPGMCLNFKLPCDTLYLLAQGAA